MISARAAVGVEELGAGMELFGGENHQIRDPNRRFNGKMGVVGRRANTADRVLMHVEQRGVRVSALSPGDCARLLQRWREVFAVRLHAQTRSWTLHRFDWHVFSFGYHGALSGAEAARAYQSVGPCDHVLLSSYLDESFGFACAGVPSDLTGLSRDVTVAALDLSWTMCFTHEPDCGPYFATPR